MTFNKNQIHVYHHILLREMLETWIDQVRLITVLGTKRWTDLNGICERASEFVNKESMKDPGFITKLAEKNVFNADEISKTLQKNFKITLAEAYQVPTS